MTRLLFCLPFLALPAFAQAQTEEVCSVTSASAVIRIAVCTADPGDEALAAEAERMCDGERNCGVWFYADAAAAPETAPENHDGLTQDQVTSSMGVYDAQDQLLMRISESD